MTNRLNIAICGATGRMGKEILLASGERKNVSVVAACTRSTSRYFGKDISVLIGGSSRGLQVTNSFESQFALSSHAQSKNVVIDFSSADALIDHASLSAKLGVALLVGVTGVTNSQKDYLKSVAKDIPVLIAPNTSIGANLLAVLSGMAAKVLNKADIEICEIHHRFKKDAPSGAAMFIGEHIAKARNQEFSRVACFDRHDAGERTEGQIGIVGLRGGTQVGTHTVHLFDNDETLEVTHRVTNRRIFATGALRAAEFLVDQTPGIYNMFDVLNINALLGEKSR